jgi:hypothetical protein
VPQYIKEKKVYHFEKQRVDSPNGYFKRVGTFHFDFSKEWPEANKYVKDALYNKQNYGHASNKPSKGNVVEDKELRDLHGNPDQQMFRSVVWPKREKEISLDNFPNMKRAFEYFELKDYTWKYNVQYPTDNLLWHIDNLPGKPTKERVLKSNTTSTTVRFLVFLRDWEPGQGVIFGNDFFHRWRSGDAWWFDWLTLPHSTFNMSWEDRPLLQITGEPTEKTNKIIREHVPFSIDS